MPIHKTNPIQLLLHDINQSDSNKHRNHTFIEPRRNKPKQLMLAIQFTKENLLKLDCMFLSLNLVEI